MLNRFKRRKPPSARPEVRDALVAELPRGGVGAELGVWKGDFSAQLLETRPTTLHLVDPWEFQPTLPDAWYGGAKAGSQEDMDAIYEAVKQRFADRPEVIVHRATSMAVELGPLDWVYIDGDHRYEAVRDELAKYEHSMRPGGVIAGDDYHDKGWWEGGVKRAVDEWAARRGVTATIYGTQFLVRLPR